MIRSLGHSNGPTNSGIYYRMFKKSCPIFRVYNILYQNCQDFKTTELSFYSGQFLWIIIIIRNQGKIHQKVVKEPLTEVQGH